jgi:hypothetical protein
VENLDAEVDINREWEIIRENIKFSAKDSLDYYQLKKHKSWSKQGPAVGPYEHSNEVQNSRRV